MSQLITVKLTLNNISNDEEVKNLLNDLNELQTKYSIIDNINVDMSGYTPISHITDMPHTKSKSEPMTVFTTNIANMDEMMPHYVYDVYIGDSTEKICTCTQVQRFEPSESFNFYSFRFNNTELNTHLSFFSGPVDIKIKIRNNSQIEPLPVDYILKNIIVGPFLGPKVEDDCTVLFCTNIEVKTNE